MQTSRLCRPLALFAGLCCLAALAAGLTGCGKGSGSSTDGEFTVGFIYVGPRDDYGYNQAHAIGAKAVKEIKGVKVEEQENVPETVKVKEAMERMIDGGAKVVFPTSFGYFKYVPDPAKEYPNVTFLHCGGLYDASKHPKNVGSYFGYIDECQYISGIVAGHTTKSKKIGFVAAKPIPQVLRNINAFTLGARSVDPQIECHVIFTGDWAEPNKEKDAVDNLASKNVDVITCHVDSPKTVVQNAKAKGIYICGYHASQMDLAPDLYLTGAEWNWQKVYTDYVTKLKAGKKLGTDIPNLVRGGLKDGIVKMSPYNEKVVSKETIKAADAAKAKLMEGNFVIFKGPLKDNTGKTVIPEGKEHVQTDPELEKMKYLVEGVVGKI
jgi:simple sugar transport system substrate-binding protein